MVGMPPALARPAAPLLPVLGGSSATHAPLLRMLRCNACSAATHAPLLRMLHRLRRRARLPARASTRLWPRSSPLAARRSLTVVVRPAPRAIRVLSSIDASMSSTSATSSPAAPTGGGMLPGAQGGSRAQGGARPFFLSFFLSLFFLSIPRYFMKLHYHSYTNLSCLRNAATCKFVGMLEREQTAEARTHTAQVTLHAPDTLHQYSTWMTVLSCRVSCVSDAAAPTLHDET